MSVRVLQIQKRSSYKYEFIQDKYSCSKDRNTFAIADGTTQSFDSETWASILTEQFVKDPTFKIPHSLDLFRRAAEVFHKKEYKFSDNPAKATLEKDKIKKGATATFLGITIDKEEVSYINCGDSNLFILNRDVLEQALFSEIDQLDSNKYFLNSRKLLSDEVTQEYFTTDKALLKKGYTVILATDALSRFLLRQENDGFNKILNIKTFDSLLNFCTHHWSNHTLEEDDVTAIIIDSSINDDLEIIPKADFSFPTEVEATFVPSIVSSATTNLFNSTEVKQLDELISDIRHLKQGIRMYRAILGFVLILVVLNSFLLFNTRSEIKKINIHQLEAIKGGVEMAPQKDKPKGGTTPQQDEKHELKKSTIVIDTGKKAPRDSAIKKVPTVRHGEDKKKSSNQN